MTAVMGFNEISNNEMDEIDGGLFVGAALGAFSGAVCGAAYESIKIAVTICTGGNAGTGSEQAKAIVSTAKDGAISGGIIGFICGA